MGGLQLVAAAYRSHLAYQILPADDPPQQGNIGTHVLRIALLGAPNRLFVFRLAHASMLVSPGIRQDGFSLSVYEHRGLSIQDPRFYALYALFSA